MPRLSALQKPDSVIRIAPTSGVFGSSAHIADEEGFCAKVICQWYQQPNNTIPVETPQHHEMARELFPFYQRFRKSVDAARNVKQGAILKCLYDTGSVKEAEAMLDECLKIA